MLSQHSVLPRIMELEQAIFFNFSQSVLKLPTSIINALHVDQVGQVWFLIQRPKQHLSEFDSVFEARLDFFKKGKDFHMQVSGKARLVIDPEEINCISHLPEKVLSQLSPNVVLVRLKVDDVRFFPHGDKEPRHFKIHMPVAQPLAFIKTLRYVIQDVIPVFQSHRYPY